MNKITGIKAIQKETGSKRLERILYGEVGEEEFCLGRRRRRRRRRRLSRLVKPSERLAVVFAVAALPVKERIHSGGKALDGGRGLGKGQGEGVGELESI